MTDRTNPNPEDDASWDVEAPSVPVESTQDAADAETAMPQPSDHPAGSDAGQDDETVEPEAVDHGAEQPEAAALDAEREPAEPEPMEPEVIEPEFIEPELTEPELTEPEPIEREPIEPEPIEPEPLEPEPLEPQPIESGVAGAPASSEPGEASASTDIDARGTDADDAAAPVVEPAASSEPGEFETVAGVTVPPRRPAGATIAAARRNPAAERRRSAVSRIVNRSLGTVAALALIAGGAYALGWMPLPQVNAEPEGLELAPVAGDQVRVCPGPLQQSGLDRDANVITPLGAAEYEVNMAGVRPTAKELVWKGPAEYVFPATGGDLVRATVSQSVRVDEPTTNGFTATNCIQPASTLWLAAGSTEVGHSVLVDVVNPGENPARVNFTVYTQAGIASPGLGEIIVAPGERTLVSVLGAAPDQAAVAVKVTSTGGDVAAFLHETITSTTTPKGAEIVGPTALPATTQILPGMWIDMRPGAHDPTAPTYLGGVVRILNPGSSPAATTMTVVDEQGTAVFTEQFDLPPQIVADYPIGGLPAGNYTVRLDSASPIVVGGRSAPMSPDDFAWVPASNRLDDTETVPVPPGPSPRLAIANPTPDARTITIDGESFTLEPDATVSVEVGEGLVELTGTEGLVGAVHFGVGDEFASLAVAPGNSDAAVLTVHD